MPKSRKPTGPLPPSHPGWLESLPPFSASRERLADVVKLASVRAGRRDMTMEEAYYRGGLLLDRYGDNELRGGMRGVVLAHTARDRALVTDTVSLLRHLTDFDRRHFGVLTGGCRLHALVFGQHERPGSGSASFEKWIRDGMPKPSE